MVEKYEFAGLFKYLGRESNCQKWKNGYVVLRYELDKWYLDTYLRCNPNQRYRSNELSRLSGVSRKQQRLVINVACDLILHFMGPGNSTVVMERLEDRAKAVLLKLKATNRQMQNRAEVGGSKYNRLVLGERSALDQKSPVCPVESSPLQSPTTQTFKMSQSEQHVPDFYLDAPLTSSPHRFTGVKENRKLRMESDSASPDEESKENQHSGLLSPESQQQSRRADRLPLGVASGLFYGSSFSSQSSSVFPKLKLRRSSTPGRKRLASDVSYSWNKTSNPPQSGQQEEQTLQGFANIGNTCYMNAILQSLCSLDTLIADLTNLHKQQGRALSSSSLAVALIRLLQLKRRPHLVESQMQKMEVLHGVKRAISSTARRFSGSQQHDAHEFLGQVLDQLKEEVFKVIKDINGQMDSTVSPLRNLVQEPATDLVLSPSPARKNSNSPGSAEKPGSLTPVVNPTSVNFEFEVVHSIECLNCQEQLLKAEQFNDLSVDIPSARLPGVTLTLQDAMDMFLEKEQIEYTCEKCGHKKAQVAHRFTKLPRVLVLHLKRYTFDMHNSHNCKMRQAVLVPRFLTLYHHCDDTTQPHTPVAYLTQNSLKSPSGSAHRRRRLFNGEKNVPNADSKDDVPPRSKVRRISGDFDENVGEKGGRDLDGKSTKDGGNFEEELELAIQLSKEEAEASRSAHNQEMALEEDEQLKQALALSIKDMETGPADHGYANSSNTFTWTHNLTPFSHHSDIAEADLEQMTMEEQVELAINRSLAQPPSIPSLTSLRSPSDFPHLNEISFQQADMALSLPSAPVVRSEGSRDKHQASSMSGPHMKPSSPVLSHTETEPELEMTELAELAQHTGVEDDMEVEMDKFQEYSALSTSAKESQLVALRQIGLSADGGLAEMRNILDSVNSFKSSMNSSDSNKDVGAIDLTDCDKQGNVYTGSAGRVSGANCFPPQSVGALGCISQSPPQKVFGTQTAGEDSDSSLPSLNFDSDDCTDSVPNNKLSSQKVQNHGLDDYLSQANRFLETVAGGMTPFARDSPTELEKDLVLGLRKSAGDHESVSHFLNAGLDFEGKKDLKMSVPLQSRTENEISQHKKERTRRHGEKENLSPSAGKGGHQTSHVDKQLEAEIARHVAHTTEAEKGNLPFSYRLVSVVSHLGASSSTGHYISDVFDMRKQAWFSYNDSNVQCTSEAEVRTGCSRNGYIFFYLSKDIYDDFCSKVPKGNEVLQRT